MRLTNAIYKLVIFSPVFLLSHKVSAQNTSALFQKNQDIQTCISYAINNEESLNIFVSDAHSTNTVNRFGSNSYELPVVLGSGNQPTPINGAGTPKGAVFCQFENKLWKSFDIGIRLRVETPSLTH